MSAPARVVLVHGAWHGAWCFDPIIGPLQQREIEVTTVDLPGHGDDAGPLGDLHDDAACVAQALDTLDAADGEVVLVGHSYGGAVVTEAGTHPSVGHLVYLAAFAIDLDESCAAAAVSEPDVVALSHDGRPDLGAALVWHEDATTTLDPELAVALLYNTCDQASQAWAVSRLGAQPMAALSQSPTATAWRERPTTYAICTDDQIVHPGLQAVLARRCTHQVEWPTDHSPFLSRPDLVVDLLEGMARSSV